MKGERKHLIKKFLGALLRIKRKSWQVHKVTAEDRTWTLHRKRVGKKRYQNNERNRDMSLERKKGKTLRMGIETLRTAIAFRFGDGLQSVPLE
jgi:hypothetical protein